MIISPEIVQVVPHDDHTVSVYFVDGKIVLYDVKPKLNRGVFKALLDMDVFMNHCGIMNDTLGWDVSGTGDLSTCIDIALETLYALEHVANEKIAG